MLWGSLTHFKSLDQKIIYYWLLNNNNNNKYKLARMSWECQRQKSSTPKACSLCKLSGQKEYNTMMWSSQNGLTSQTVDRFQMSANILLKPVPHPWWLLASISWFIQCCSDGLAARAPAECCAYQQDLEVAQNWRTASRTPVTYLKVT